MTRKGTDDDGSLDLLLDTICNTFGGVLFISMLVVVLLNMTSREVAFMPPAADSQTVLVNSKKQLAQIRYEMSRLRQAIEVAKTVGDSIVDKDLAGLLQELTGSRDRRGDIQDDKSQRLDRIAQSQIETNKLAQEIKDRKDAMDQARKRLALADERLKQEIALRTRTSELPTPKTTKKIQVPLLLCKGRLCSYAKLKANGQLAASEEECELTQDGEKKYLAPRPNTGTRIDPAGDRNNAVSRKLAVFDKDRHYLKIFVWPDSFQHFAVVRTVMVASQFEYSLIPFPEDERICIGASDQKDVVF